MRHRKSGRHLNRTSSHRQAMFRNMAARCCARADQDHRAQGQGAAARRGAADHAGQEKTAWRIAGSPSRALRDRDMVTKLFTEMVRATAERPGGYTHPQRGRRGLARRTVPRESLRGRALSPASSFRVATSARDRPVHRLRHPRPPYLGQMRAVLHDRAPTVPVVDLMSDAPAFDPRAAGCLLDAVRRPFPDGTVFVCVVDPGVGTREREPVILHPSRLSAMTARASSTSCSTAS